MPVYPYVPYVMLKVSNCKNCPHCDTKLTKGYGHATDYFCKLDADKKLIKGYCEWQRDEPQDGEIPAWCPLIKLMHLWTASPEQKG